jgi:signal transduction histidine kinase
MFMNLLLNAMEAIRRTGRPGTIRIRTSSEDGHVRIEVADDGEGIPAEDRDRIFDPGFTTKGVKVGIGLGLPICYRIVQAHGGTIEAGGEPGDGATITVTLPVEHRGGLNQPAAGEQPPRNS